MSWNGSSQTGSAAPSPVQKPSGKSPSLIRGLIAGGIVITIAVVTLIFFGNGDHVADETVPSARDSIKEETPRSVVTNVVSEEKEEVPYWLVDASQTNGFTREMLHKWRDRHAPPPGYVGKKPNRKSAWHIFEHRSENLLASILRAKPGSGFIGRPNYRGITQDFLKSCEAPIIVNADDSEYVKNLKRDMIKVKIELKPRIDAGEDLGEIIEEARAEGRRMAEYRQTLKKELLDLAKKDAKTIEDVDDFESAANKILEAKGVAPLKLGTITKQYLISNAMMKEDE